MRKSKKMLILLFLFLFTVIEPLPITAGAQQLTDGLSVIPSDGQDPADMTDDNIYTYNIFSGGETVTISSQEPITGLYIMWNETIGSWTYSANGNTYTGGEYGFLHEYLTLETPAEEVILNIPDNGAEITDIYVFSDGELPNWVQVWEEPVQQADILLFAAHSDDEQLFFAGLLPYYAIEVGAKVQLVYMTHHWDTDTRNHELLDGLWTVGIRNYPVLSDFIDNAAAVGSDSEDRETVLERARSVYNEDEWVLFQVQQLRRFQPQVVVSHDLNGEYGHGAHMLTSDALTQAVELSGNADYDPDSVEMYGVWDVPKTYFHLYGEDQIVIDYDISYESMNELTPFEMSKLGYARHLSQQWTWFTKWISVDKAKDITTYSPCLFGLYRSTVGTDNEKNDLLENITLYSNQQTAEEETQRQAEEETQQQAEEETQQQAEEETQQQAGDQENPYNGGNSMEEEEQTEWYQTSEGILTIGILALLLIVLIVLVVMFFVQGRKDKKSREENK